MSVHGIVQNVKWPELVLTPKDGGLVGEKYGGTATQRWIGKYKWDPKTQGYLGTVKNDGSGDYLAWNTDTKAVMSPKEHWWQVVFQGGHVGFQVPHTAQSPAAFRTLQLEADKSVILKNQEGTLIDAQLWDILEG
ncbi:uncharacterized protein BJ212DRAFT_1296114 [Suillus subaureus]|uniref:Uncharacterized protein n=2 Tax=Suillus subaureus TaxID=48587 RepID=A0A9P7EJ22_9AGAM|nr:uncharacterized protein BJ212DRAFT_1296113 [Suillus subaureus]XP_041197553.1 uncharacterized protein BJ212DRAFT_1296114 [Suillus subaureus]KAG1823492.1 hypothetical protein BJ212DRAFT_1296113 [Suillus subaureus]KAG1823493.1 hypothetical protein BJ212DRAFT_1296114 [Suillus subaureus]